VQLIAQEISAEEQQQQQRVMSFLIRSRNSQKWARSGSTAAATSFSVRTGRRTSGESDSVVLRSGGLGIEQLHATAPSYGSCCTAHTSSIQQMKQQQQQQQLLESHRDS
jgi:hypothetical protein